MILSGEAPVDAAALYQNRRPTENGGGGEEDSDGLQTASAKATNGRQPCQEQLPRSRSGIRQPDGRRRICRIPGGIPSRRPPTRTADHPPRAPPTQRSTVGRPSTAAAAGDKLGLTNGRSERRATTTTKRWQQRLRPRRRRNESREREKPSFRSRTRSIEITLGTWRNPLVVDCSCSRE